MGHIKSKATEWAIGAIAYLSAITILSAVVIGKIISGFVRGPMLRKLSKS